MNEEIYNKVYNIDLVVEDIKKFPQTYNTILQDIKKDGTCQTILRRKLNVLCRDGTVCKTSIPGTRFGKVIFYHIPKDYHILVEAGRAGSNVYCFFKFKKESKFYLRIKPYWELESGLWMKKDEKVLFEGNVLKWI